MNYICLILQEKLIYKKQQEWIHPKADLANLKSNVNKFNIDKLKNVPTNIRNLKSKVDKLDVDKLTDVPIDLSKLSHLVKHVVKKDV